MVPRIKSNVSHAELVAMVLTAPEGLAGVWTGGV
jgi:hypothetical protein